MVNAEASQQPVTRESSICADRILSAWTEAGSKGSRCQLAERLEPCDQKQCRTTAAPASCPARGPRSGPATS